VQRTFTILKPDSVKAGNAGLIIDRLIKEGFQIRAMKLVSGFPSTVAVCAATRRNTESMSGRI